MPWRKPIRSALMAGALFLFSACSPFAAINLLVPRTGYTVTRGLAYGSDPRQKLDIYVPDGLKSPAPVLLFFYGGGWQGGNRADYLAFGEAFASQGIVTVVADYRLYPQVRWPAFVEDGARALAFVHAHIGDYHGDPTHLFVSGHSAGAYNAVMLASDPKYLAAVGGDFSWMRGVIGIAGPYDFLPLTDPGYIAIFGGAENQDSMPINHIRRENNQGRPPMLLATGDADTVVGPGNSSRMAARLKALGDEAELVTYPGAGHISIILSLVPGFRGTTHLREDITRFIHAHQ